MSRHRDSSPPKTPVRPRLRPAPTRRGPVLVAALVLGALLAWLGEASGPGLTAGNVAAPGAGIGGEGPIQLGEDTSRRVISEAEAAARLADLEAGRAEREAANRAALPVDGRLTSCFCMRWGTMHTGLDIAAVTGTPILAAEAGVVLLAGPNGGYGNAVYLQHANGDVTLYAHSSRVLVEAGQFVEAGAVIAEVGSTGNSTGPHLHIEVRSGGRDGERMDPGEWLRARGVDISGVPIQD